MKNKAYSTLTKPMTACELVDNVLAKMKEEKLYPDFLDYAHGDSYRDGTREITYYGFDVETVTKYGCNEGVYTDFYLMGIFDATEPLDKRERIYVGCAKTLNEGKEAVREMYEFAANFYITATKYINENINDFSWKGFDMRFEGEQCSHECYTDEQIISVLERYIQKGKDLSKLVITRLEDREILPIKPFVDQIETLDNPVYWDTDYYQIYNGLDGEKRIHIVGYFYNEGDDNGKGSARELSYCGFALSLKEFLDKSFDYDTYQSDLKQYINDMTPDTAEAMMKYYFGVREEITPLPYEKLTLNTPVGYYVNSKAV